jgi:hypothetical protein
MMISYDLLLSLTVTHPYFLSKERDADGKYTYNAAFEDFELIPDKKTGALMNSLKLIAKKINNTWNLFFQTAGPFATTAGSLVNKEFFFEMKITNDVFYKVTGSDYLPAPDEMLWFNSPIDSLMVPEKRKVQEPLKFDYTIHHDMRPVNIKVITSKGDEIINDTITDVLVKTDKIDVTAQGENIYNINEDTVPPGSLMNEKIFVKEATAPGSFYGMVYFKVLPVAANAANSFKINVKGNN